MKVTLEVCCGSLESVRQAAAGGADRIELCSGLDVGGLTPSAGLIRAAVGVGVPVMVLIRPRGGDFLYTADEVELMAYDAHEALALGAAGVVIGALTREGEVDVEACRRIMGEGRAVTFHRAFDLCRDPFRALRHIAALGCQRVLTSGQAATAEEGIPLLRRLVAADLVSIMPGSGVTEMNARRILEATGAHEIHASLRARRESLMAYRRGGVAMGQKGSDEYAWMETSEERVRALTEVI